MHPLKPADSQVLADVARRPTLAVELDDEVV
jgi:hypothetical protein